jgi:hypothetical protein
MVNKVDDSHFQNIRMKTSIISVLLFFVSFLSCSRRLCGCDPVQPLFIKAVVTDISNIDCNRPVVVIDVTDTAAVSRVTGVYTDTYVASQIPSALRIAGQKIFIDIAAFASGEDFFCTTIGPAIPHLKVTAAAIRN